MLGDKWMAKKGHYVSICDAEAPNCWTDRWVTCDGGLVCYFVKGLYDKGDYTYARRIDYKLNKYGIPIGFRIKFGWYKIKSNGIYIEKRILKGKYWNVGNKYA